MTSTLQSIRDAIGIGARSNLFQVTYDATAYGSDAVAGQASFLTKAAALPSSTLGVIEVPFRGRRLKIPGDRTFPEWTATVLNDDRFVTRAALEDFQRKFNATSFTATDLGNREGSTSTVTVEQLSSAGEVISKYELFNCWISELGAIDLSYDSVDALEEYTVTWVYEYYKQS